MDTCPKGSDGDTPKGLARMVLYSYPNCYIPGGHCSALYCFSSCQINSAAAIKATAWSSTPPATGGNPFSYKPARLITCQISPVTYAAGHSSSFQSSNPAPSILHPVCWLKIRLHLSLPLQAGQHFPYLRAMATWIFFYPQCSAIER